MRKLILLVCFLTACADPVSSVSDEKKLVFSIDKGDYPQVKEELEKGVQVNVPVGRDTALMYASGANLLKPEYVEIESGNKLRSVEKVRIIELLLSYGADPNVRNDEGKTALHYAVINGWVGTVWLLLNNGANPNEQDDFLSTPMWYAINHCHKQIFDLLEAYGGVVPAEESLKDVSDASCDIDIPGKQ
ncbi:ankyrin repeat domain-containing protein [Microbulbifer sp. VAAC004]|uniref:ankyrin repeat domain-containing protein n=1 Tax=unclassified Microbulbifer TaxID=2619833 RepID=UPI004039566B